MAFHPVETEAVVEALLTQGVPTQYIGVPRELHSGFTTKISQFYTMSSSSTRREGFSMGVPYPQSPP
ncbi:unnamed protein product [Heligmosomoides polygyrus]|uniref:TPP_enzyme_N domain-containing protein n=1 Tax=Heligmosomoides polygyrus TaxID=6339 RepID=A0A183GW46_HELPZ|nr:unnamed protein product [Heligmosomoides polygyrus]